jgi:hypothetical protein
LYSLVSSLTGICTIQYLDATDKLVKLFAIRDFPLLFHMQTKLSGLSVVARVFVKHRSCYFDNDFNVDEVIHDVVQSRPDRRHIQNHFILIPTSQAIWPQQPFFSFDDPLPSPLNAMTYIIHLVVPTNALFTDVQSWIHTAKGYSVK